MRFEWVTHDDGRSGVVVARLDAGDATPPVDALYLDVEPRARHKDHLAVACALAFGRYVGEVFGPPAGMSERTSSAIQHFLSPRAIRPLHVRGGADAPALGGVRSVRVVPGTGTPSGFVHTSEPSDDFTLNLLRMDLFTGSVLSRDALWVATNSELVGAASAIAALHTETAVAMLLAADLGVGSVQVSNNVGDAELKRLSVLLGAVGVGVVVRR